MPKAESYEIFVHSLDSSASSGSNTAAFTAFHNFKSSSNSGHLGEGRSFRRGRGHADRNTRVQNRPIHCQICRGEGHHASSCQERYIQPPNTANLVEAFTSCSVNDGKDSDWYAKTSVIAHMTHDVAQLDKATVYSSKDHVVVGNGTSLPISHTDTFSPTTPVMINDQFTPLLKNGQPKVNLRNVVSGLFIILNASRKGLTGLSSLPQLPNSNISFLGYSKNGKTFLHSSIYKCSTTSFAKILSIMMLIKRCWKLNHLSGFWTVLL